MTIKMLQYLIPFYEPDAKNWSLEARLLLWLTFLWIFMGLITLYSASYPVASLELGDGLYYFKRQIIWILIGMLCFKVIVRSPLYDILWVTPWSYLFIFGLIVGTVIGLGENLGGAERWLKIGPVLIQPSEFLKPFLVLQAATLFGDWERKSWGTRLFWLGIFAVTLGAILLQPNLSTTALCGMSLWLIALAAGFPFRYLGGVALTGIFTAYISISVHEYQMRRITSFLNPWADPKGSGYQLIQSLLAIGSGGTWGSGFGFSQQKLFYLPIQYTDFIFAVFAEEFGFVGSVALLLMIFSYATLALIVAFKSSHPIKRLIAIGVMVVLVGQSLINIGVATGGLPTTGLPFPLFSYGGSSVMGSILLASLLIKVAREGNGGQVISLANKR
jgi:cell division protein FtsW